LAKIGHGERRSAAHKLHFLRDRRPREGELPQLQAATKNGVRFCGGCGERIVLVHQYPVASAASTLTDTHFREAALPIHYYFIVCLIGAAVALMVVTLGAVVVASLS
jgi:hypothetical protein